MSDRPVEEVGADSEVVEYMEAEHVDGESPDLTTKLDGSSSVLDDLKKVEYTNLPKLDEEEPDWESKSPEELREWLREHSVKGTWQKKLLQKCREVWEDMQAVLRERTLASGGLVPEHLDETEPNFEEWSMERKRTFLRRRDVKGIWGKYVDQKCAEIWALERTGEKYVHTPPSLGRSKSRFPGQSIFAMSPSSITSAHPDVAPMAISQHDFHELAGAAQKSDLKRVTDLLNTWSQKNMLPEEAPSTSTSTMDEPVMTPDGPDLRWVHTDFTSDASSRPKQKRSSTTPAGTPSAKRKKTANGQAAPADDDYDETISTLHARIALLENQNTLLLQENQSLKDKLVSRK